MRFVSGLRIPVLSLITTLSLWQLPVQAAPLTVEAERQYFKQALKALNAHHLDRFLSLQAKLSDYELSGYLEYRYLRQQLHRAKPLDMQIFLQRWGATPWGSSLKRQWLNKLAKEKKWQLFLAYQRTPPTQSTQACYYYRAHLAAGDREQALEGARQLWLHGKSRPKACDPLFAALKQANRLTEQLIWERLQLAVTANQYSLANYLRNKLKGPYKSDANALLAVYRQPTLLKQNSHFRGSSPKNQRLVKVGLHRLLKKNPDLAITLWSHYRESARFSADDRQAFELEAVRLLLGHFNKNQIPWVDSVLARLPNVPLNLMEARLRNAILQEDWPAINRLTDSAPTPLKAQLAIQYWGIRADEKLQLTKPASARRAYSRMANQRRFYSFLAADRAGIPYDFNHQPTAINQTALARIQDSAAVKRVREFTAVGFNQEARREWEYLIRSLDDLHREAASIYARQQQWSYLGIRNAIVAKLHNDIDLRFPLAFEQVIRKEAKNQSLDSSLIFAVARQESAFWPYAASSAGARGLMQLMPATARQTARKHRIRYNGLYQLYTPEVNVRLGTAYLQELLDRFEGDRARATAAYNAGPHRVSQWDRKRKGLETDAWIETIPFRETRNYVKNVLAYTAIYSERLSYPPPRIIPTATAKVD